MEVVAVSAGPMGAEAVLRDALACGAARAHRLDALRLSESRDVGAALADVVGDARVVVCGDHSLDRGSGSVPAYIAHGMRAAQALGLVSLDLTASSPSALSAVRRLDGGRREIVSVPTPCVISVEHSVASLRRGSLRRALAADAAQIRGGWIITHRRGPARGRGPDQSISATCPGAAGPGWSRLTGPDSPADRCRLGAVTGRDRAPAAPGGSRANHRHPAAVGLPRLTHRSHGSIFWTLYHRYFTAIGDFDTIGHTTFRPVQSGAVAWPHVAGGRRRGDAASCRQRCVGR